MPHGSLACLSPIEVFNGAIPDKTLHKKDHLIAKKQRILINREYSCGIC